jgi:segregation and condensation protein B
MQTWTNRMSTDALKNIVEAALLAAGRSITLNELLQLFDVTARPEVAQLREALQRLGEDYAGRGIELKETGAGWRVQVRRELANEISKLWPERPPRYSRALLETLALIAYRQPLTRAEIEAVRGVAVNPNIIKTLLERSWIRVVGHRDLPGHPELLGTTRDFLDYFGLRTLEELPPLAELKALSEIEPQLELPPLAALPSPDDLEEAEAPADVTELEAPREPEAS